jgi:hypothetical protein
LIRFAAEEDHVPGDATQVLPLVKGGHGNQPYLPGLASLGGRGSGSEPSASPSGIGAVARAALANPDLTGELSQQSSTLSHAESAGILSAATGRALVEVPWHTVQLGARNPVVEGDGDAFADAELRAFNVSEFRPSSNSLHFRLDEDSMAEADRPALAVHYEPSLFGHPTEILIETLVYIAYSGNPLHFGVTFEVGHSGADLSQVNVNGGLRHIVLPVELGSGSGAQWMTLRPTGWSRPLEFRISSVFIKAPS